MIGLWERENLMLSTLTELLLSYYQVELFLCPFNVF